MGYLATCPDCGVQFTNVNAAIAHEHEGCELSEAVDHLVRQETVRLMQKAGGA